MMEIKHVIVTTRQPSGKGDLGACEEGHYTVSAGVVTMCSADGTPLRGTFGERITHTLVPGGESERAVAMRLTLRQWQSGRDDDPNGFNRPLRYQRLMY